MTTPAPEVQPAPVVEVNPPAAPTSAPVPPPVVPEPPVYPPELGDPGKRAIDRMAAERDAANAEKAAAMAKLKQIEDRDLSELDRLKRDAAEAADALVKERAKGLHNQVAIDTGLPVAVIASLSGSTQEELVAAADALKAWRGEVTPAGPLPDRGQGPRPQSADAAEDAEYQAYFNNNRK